MISTKNCKELVIHLAQHTSAWIPTLLKLWHTTWVATIYHVLPGQEAMVYIDCNAAVLRLRSVHANFHLQQNLYKKRFEQKWLLAMQKSIGVTSKHKVNTATKVKTNQDEHINQGEKNIM